MVSAEPRGYRPSDAGSVVSKPWSPWQSGRRCEECFCFLDVFLLAGYDPKAHKMATDYVGAPAVPESSSLNDFQTIRACAHTHTDAWSLSPCRWGMEDLLGLSARQGLQMFVMCVVELVA